MRYFQLKIGEKIPEIKFQNWALEWRLSLIGGTGILVVFLVSYFKSKKE